MRRGVFVASLLFCLGFVCAEVRDITFEKLEDENGQKIVVFYDEGKASQEALAVLEAISQDERLQSWEAVKVGASLEANKQKVEDAGFNVFPQVFTNSASGGVEKWPGDFNKASVDKWYEFKMKVVTKDRVKRFENLKRNINTVARGNKPVFVKLYEEWCPHCKKMKKDFQVASNEAKNFHWFEVECSKTTENTKFCQHLGSSGYPTLYVLSKGKMAKYEDGRTYEHLISFAQTFESKKESLEWDTFPEFDHSVVDKSSSNTASSTPTTTADAPKSTLSDTMKRTAHMTDILERLEEEENVVAGLTSPPPSGEVAEFKERLASLETKVDKILALLEGKK